MSKIIQLFETETCYDCGKDFKVDDTVCCQGEIEIYDEDGCKIVGTVKGDLQTRCLDCNSDYEYNLRIEFLSENNLLYNDTESLSKDSHCDECHSDSCLF